MAEGGGGGCEWGARRAPSVRLLFRDERTIPAILEFPEKTRVGKVLGLALLGWGSQTWMR